MNYYNNFINSIFENQTTYELSGVLADICMIYNFIPMYSNNKEYNKIKKLFHQNVGDNDTIINDCKRFFENDFLKILTIIKEKTDTLLVEDFYLVEDEDIKNVNKLLNNIKYSKKDLLLYFDEI